MKQCPLCKNTYSDNSLQFCLQDGETLFELTNEQPTQAFSTVNDYPTQAFPSKINPIQIPIEKDSSPQTVISPPNNFSNTPPQKEKSGLKLIIGLLIGFILVLTFGIIFVAGYFVWSTQQQEIPATVVSNKAETEVKNPPPGETEDLKNKIADLEKQIKEQNKKTPPPTQTPETNISFPTPQPTKLTAKANSPGDGFLALRSQPSTQTGTRILKIPHGAPITVWGCLEKQSGSKGRWCQVDYNGTKGWANDGYVTYD